MGAMKTIGKILGGIGKGLWWGTKQTYRLGEAGVKKYQEHRASQQGNLDDMLDDYSQPDTWSSSYLIDEPVERKESWYVKMFQKKPKVDEFGFPVDDYGSGFDGDSYGMQKKKPDAFSALGFNIAHLIGRIAVGIGAYARGYAVKMDQNAGPLLDQYRAIDAEAFDCLPDAPQYEGGLANLKALKELQSTYSGGEKTEVIQDIGQCMLDNYTDQLGDIANQGAQGFWDNLGEAFTGQDGGFWDNLGQAFGSLGDAGKQITELPSPLDLGKSTYELVKGALDVDALREGAGKAGMAALGIAMLVYQVVPLVQYGITAARAARAEQRQFNDYNF